MDAANSTENAAVTGGPHWWTWFAPAIVAVSPPGWHLALPVGITLAHYWGPRVLAGIWAGSVCSSIVLGSQPLSAAMLYAGVETAGVACAWLLFSRVSRGICCTRGDAALRAANEYNRLLSARTAELAREIENLKKSAESYRELYEAERTRACNHAEDYRKLVAAEKMTSLGTLASGIAHEINNPNGAIRLGVEALDPLINGMLRIIDEYRYELGDVLVGHLSYDEARKEIPQVIEGILAGSSRIARIVRDLSDYAHQQEPAAMQPGIDVNQAVRSAVELVSGVIRSCTTRFDVHYEEHLPVIEGNSGRLERAVANLLLNACQALPSADRKIRLSTRFEKDVPAIVIEVMDEGIGINEKILARVTDPFFTTKRSQGGAGLGLAVSASIMAQHQGRLEFESVAGAGTTVRAVLPCRAITKEAHV
jgi:polar amino acid transport system substrate-binding protein